MIEPLPSNCEALSSNSSTTKKKKKEWGIKINTPGILGEFRRH
jgi:hypothetical protein